MDVAQLNAAHGIAGALEFTTGTGGLPIAIMTAAAGSAVVTLYGAHVLSYRPRGRDEVLWMSSRTEYAVGTPIRGGIPVCFPWFGPHANDAKKPQHGFARVSMWNVAGTELLPDGGVQLRLSLTDSDATKALWPHAFSAEVTVTVDSALDVSLRCANTGTQAFTYSDALHSYFAVSDAAAVKIRGLGGSAYFEAMGTVEHRQASDVLEIRKEENRRYTDTAAECLIDDAAKSRTIRVAKRGSRVTVVWNPWEETAKKIADMPDDGYRTMVCVEAVNAYADAVHVEPGAQFTLSTRIAVD